MRVLATIIGFIVRADLKKISALMMALSICVASIFAGDPSPESSSVEYQIKAAFMTKFVKFVTWPPGVFNDSDGPFVIGIFGDDPFGSIMDDATADLTMKKRRFTIKRFDHPQDVDNCHILFIGKCSENQFQHILKTLSQKPVLTVGEMRQFDLRGGMINFIIKDNNVRFTINVDAARSCGIEISTRLLRMAETVYHQNNVQKIGE